MVSESELHFISAIAIFLSSIIPVYMGVHLRRDLQKLAAMLAGFIIIHGIYHSLAFMGYQLLAEGVFEPLSVIALIAFGSVYLVARRTRKNLEVSGK